MDTRDSNGTILRDGDSVTLIKDLKVKGSSITLKRGTVVKKIRLFLCGSSLNWNLALSNNNFANNFSSKLCGDVLLVITRR